MILLALLIIVAGTIAASLGQGGGIMYTPVQVWYGIPFHQAATTSLFLIMVTSFSASIVYRKAKRIDMPMALTLESTTAVGGFLGGLWSSAFSGAALSIVFAFVVATAAVFMIGGWVRRASRNTDGTYKKGWFRWRRQLGDHHYSVNLAIGLPGAFLAGLASGLVGIGGGILKVPLMVLLLGVPMEIAVGSSAFMVGITAAGGFTGHLIHGHWDWKMSLILAVCAFLGAQMGGNISLRVNAQRLKKVTGWFLLFIAASMLIRALIHS